MSTLASKVAALERHRGAVARELATVCEVYERDGSPGFDLDMVGILSGKHFDVHAAREHAKTLVALADEQAVFEDWTRDKGLGPENREPGAFTDCGACGGSGVERRPGFVGWDEPGDCEQCGGADEGEVRGGWPGKLAREWARRQKSSQRQDGPPPSGSPKVQPFSARSAPMGRSLARLGQRILDMLEGQPDACQACYGTAIGKTETHGPFEGQGGEVSFTLLEHPCEPCHGTGHNLGGQLPEVEWSPAVMRRMADEQDGRGDWYRDHPERLLPPTWLTRLPISGMDLPTETRVCPRGEHRTAEDPNERAWGFTGLRAELDHDGYKRGEHVRVHGYGKGRWRPRTTHDKPEHACTPRWRRGEIEHARQRRERARQRRWQLAEAPSVETTTGSDRFANVHRARFRVLGVAAFEYFRDCMDDRSPVDLTRISSGMPDGEWVVDGLSTEADTAGGLTWTEVSITRLIRVEMPGRIESVRVEGAISTE